MMNETFPILVRNVRIQRTPSSQNPPVRDPLGPQSEGQEGTEVENGMWGCVWPTEGSGMQLSVSVSPAAAVEADFSVHQAATWI